MSNSNPRQELKDLFRSLSPEQKKEFSLLATEFAKDLPNVVVDKDRVQDLKDERKRLGKKELKF